MDLTVALRLQARAEGTSAIRGMREELKGLATASQEAREAFNSRVDRRNAQVASAMKEVREAARAGRGVDVSTMNALGGFDALQTAMAKARDEIARGIEPPAAADEEKLFRGRLRMTNEQAKVRKRESERAALAEQKAMGAEQRGAEETQRFRSRMWAQQRREAEETASAEAKAAQQAAREEAQAAQEAARAQERADRETQRSAQETLQFRMRMTRQMTQEMGEQEARQARQRRENLRKLGLGMFVRGGSGEHDGGHGGHGSRSIASELRTAAGYTLVYGGINKVLEGVGAVADSPFRVGRMTLGVAQQAREIAEASKALGVSARDYQAVRYAFAAKGMKEDEIDPMLRFMERNAVAAIRNTKSQAVAFKALGISTDELRRGTRDPIALLNRVGDALDRVGNASKRNAVAQMIFGRGGDKYLPLFMGGGLRGAAADADASGAMLTDAQLKQSELLAAQWSKLKMQGEGLRNQVAVAAMPVVSDVLAGASEYLTDHRAEIAKTIRDDFAELRSDMPGIVSGMKAMADDIVVASKAVGPFVDGMIKFGNSPFGKYMLSGQIIPGLDMGKPMAPQIAAQGPPQQLYDPETHMPIHAAPGGRLDVHIHAPPGMGATASAPPPGTTVNVHRGLQALN